MTIRHLITTLAALLSTVTAPLHATADSATSTALPPDQAQFPELVVMLRTDSRGRESLCTPVARYKDKDGRIVDLIGAVHLGDARYYHALNRSMARYDKVLYEMVDGEDLPEMNRIAKKIADGSATPEEIARYRQYQAERENSTLGVLLGGYYAYVADLMQLSLQADHIDYSRTNLVYADMSSAEFAAAMEERGESWFTLVLDAMKESDNSSNSLNLFSTNPTELRRMLCHQLVATAHGTRTEQRAIIVSRNERCMQVLDRVLADTEAPARTIAIFYGAMHLRDMHHRLIQRGFEQVGVQWVSAIRIER